jgi:hypothetical protein
VPHRARTECRPPLPREQHGEVITEARDVDADALLRPVVLRQQQMPVLRVAHFLDPEQRVETRGRELAEHVDFHPRVVAAPAVDLLLRPFDLDARRAVRGLGVAGDLDDVPERPVLVARAVERALERLGVAGLHQLVLDARGERGFGRRHNRLRHRAALVEHEERVVFVEAGERRRLALGVSRARPRLGRREPRRRHLVADDARLRPGERLREQRRHALPLRELGPEPVAQVVFGDRRRRDLGPPAGEQEIPNQPRQQARLARPLAGLHRDAIDGGEDLEAFGLPRVGLGVEELAHHADRVRLPAQQHVARDLVQGHQSVDSAGGSGSQCVGAACSLKQAH